jgi:hypothetical protein
VHGSTDILKLNLGEPGTPAKGSDCGRDHVVPVVSTQSAADLKEEKGVLENKFSCASYSGKRSDCGRDHVAPVVAKLSAADLEEETGV